MEAIGGGGGASRHNSEEKKDVGLPEMILHTIGKETFTIGDIPFIPIQVMHREMPVLGFRIGDFTYITDANFIAPEEQEKIKGSKVLILNALRPEPHPTHFTLQEALDIVADIVTGKQIGRAHV